MRRKCQVNITFNINLISVSSETVSVLSLKQRCVPMGAVSHTVEMYQLHGPVTRASLGLPSVLIGITERQTISLNCKA